MTKLLTTRREAFRTIARWALLAGGIGGVTILATRKGEACNRNALCGGCPALRGCGLPASRRYRDLRSSTQAHIGAKR